MPIGDLTAFLTYIIQILFAVLMATIMFVMVPRAAVSAQRIMEVLDTQPTIVDPEQPGDGRGPGRPVVEFRDVEFRYPGAEEPVLSGISFTARPGETTAIVGSTGSGKTTLISLIPRFYEVTGGSVLVDGVDVRELAQQDLWSRIGLVPQKSFLFSGSVADNLRHGDQEAADEQLWQLPRDRAGQRVRRGDARAARGADRPGRRQRLRRAAPAPRHRPGAGQAGRRSRSSTTASRRWTSRPTPGCARRCASETADATVIIVAQRVGTIMHADQIIVLDDDGTIAGIGTHDELLETCETYREIVTSQLGVEGAA